MERFASRKSFGGRLDFYKHPSSTCNCEMRFSCFMPMQASTENPLPVLYWLSGLECTEENFMAKSGVQKYATEHNIIVVAPDTSPRGCGIKGEEQDFFFGTSAGYYVNATEEKWSKHYNMYDYITQELPALISQNFPVTKRIAISGHSMGGHGAMIIAIRNPQKYTSVSAFSPISAPCITPWGENAFRGYLGNNKEDWKLYDTSYLVAAAKEKIPILIDVGGDDPLLETQLRIDVLEKSAHRNNYPLTININEGYDHSYYFVASFIEEHIKYHAEHLHKKS